MAALDDVATLLRNAGVVEGATGWELALGRESEESQDQVVTVLEDRNATPPDTQAEDEVEYDYVRFTVRTRGTKWRYDQARDRAGAVMTALQDAAPTGWVYLYAVSSIYSVGYDVNDRPHLAQEFEGMIAREGTG